MFLFLFLCKFVSTVYRCTELIIRYACVATSNTNEYEFSTYLILLCKIIYVNINLLKQI